MLVSRANAAAAIAATSRVVKLLRRRAARTAARAARRRGRRTGSRASTRTRSTRSALMPASSVIRGLSTTARIRSPMLE